MLNQLPDGLRFLRLFEKAAPIQTTNSSPAHSKVFFRIILLPQNSFFWKLAWKVSKKSPDFNYIYRKRKAVSEIMCRSLFSCRCCGASIFFLSAIRSNFRHNIFSGFFTFCGRTIFPGSCKSAGHSHPYGFP